MTDSTTWTVTTKGTAPYLIVERDGGWVDSLHRRRIEAAFRAWRLNLRERLSW